MELSKSGEKDNLIVQNMTIFTLSVENKGKKIDTETFTCKEQVHIGGSKPISKSQLCTAGPYTFTRIHNATFKIGNGKEDGTNDAVIVKICSDTNLQQ